MGTGLSRPDGSPINFGDADDDIREASERLLKEWKEEQKKADAAEAQRQAELDERNAEWTAYLQSPEYAAEQQKKRKQLEDAFQVLRRRFLREHGARFGLEVPPPSSSDDEDSRPSTPTPTQPVVGSDESVPTSSPTSTTTEHLDDIEAGGREGEPKMPTTGPGGTDRNTRLKAPLPLRPTLPRGVANAPLTEKDRSTNG